MSWNLGELEIGQGGLNFVKVYGEIEATQAFTYMVLVLHIYIYCAMFTHNT